jgi:two-component system, cell cycle sensor histidine kinase and response regulator CckA
LLPERLSSVRASFQFKIFSIITLLTFLISCVFITLHIYDKAAETRRHAEKEVHLLAQQLSDAVRLPLYAENIDLLELSAQKIGRVPGISSVLVYAVDGRVLARFQAPGIPVSGELIGETLQVLSLPVEMSLESGINAGLGAPAAPIGTVRVVRRSDDLRRALYQDVLFSGLLATAFWLALSGLSFLLFRRVTRSYNALVRGVRIMQTGDYASRIDIVSADEPGRVALAVNGLAQSLQLREAENRRLNDELVNSIQTEVRARRELARANRALELEIAERAHAEQTARRSEQALKSVLDVMPVGVVATDWEGRVEYVNESLVQSFGYPREEFSTLYAWFERVFPEPSYRRQVADWQREALAQGSGQVEPQPLEARVTCRDGVVRRVILSNQLAGSRIIFIVFDITDRELMQEQAVKVQKLESLGVLAGGIAHNFNNALTGVLGFISLAGNALEPGHDAQEYLHFAAKAALRAAGMAKQLLTFASGGAPIKKTVSLAKLLDEVVSLTLNVSNVRCQLELPASLPWIRADEGQLVQAFSNIVINAMQAMPEGGTIAVRAQCGLESCTDPNHGPGYVSLSICDQGQGIAESDLPKIFDPYFSTKQSNTGLGLASVHSIIYKHGGHISVSSRLGGGTTFTICLPTTSEGPAPGGPAPGRRERQGLAQGEASGAVLVMDDEELVREFSLKTLQFLGYQAVTCGEGGEALALYRESLEAGSPFLAVILDLTVPGGMGGVEAARCILELDPSARLIVSSGYSYDPVMARHKDYGFCAAVAKPYKADELSYELRLLH